MGYGSSGQGFGSAIAFPFELASAPTVDEPPVDSADAHCTGSATAPTAPSGYLCIYVQSDGNVTPYDGFSVYPFKVTYGVGADRSGAEISIYATTTGDNTFAFGSWAVTAP
jgi:hypothetical protein